MAKKKGTKTTGNELSTRAKWIIAITVIVCSAIFLGLGLWLAFRDGGGGGGGGGSGGGGSSTPSPAPEIKCSSSFPGACYPDFNEFGLVATATDVAEIQKEFGKLPQVNDGLGRTKDLGAGDNMEFMLWTPPLDDSELEKYNDRLYSSLTLNQPNRRVGVSTIQIGVSGTLSSARTSDEDAPGTGIIDPQPDVVGFLRYNPVLIATGKCLVCN